MITLKHNQHYKIKYVLFDFYKSIAADTQNLKWKYKCQEPN